MNNISYISELFRATIVPSMHILTLSAKHHVLVCVRQILLLLRDDVSSVFA
jgi:hypothetical protein